MKLYGYRVEHISEIKSLISAFVTNNQPIEELRIEYVDTDLAKMVQKLKTIRVLHIYNTSESIIVNLVKHLPAVEYLCIGGTNKKLRFSIATKILQLNTRINAFEMRQDLLTDTKIDFNDFDLILALAADRVKVKFFYDRYGIRYLNSDDRILLKTLFAKKTEWVHFVPEMFSN